jgi:hypothetical protein
MVRINGMSTIGLLVITEPDWITKQTYRRKGQAASRARCEAVWAAAHIPEGVDDAEFERLMRARFGSALPSCATAQEFSRKA